MKNALIIFVRCPVLGRIKTRLAATIGDEKTLQIYVHLLQHTKEIAQNITATKFVFYADHINEDDIWNGYEKRSQQGYNLGDRMKNAFEELFAAGFQNVCIIGSDCYELSSDILHEACANLDTCKIVVGPANDGGYYLLGMQLPFKDVFADIAWSTENVFAQTIEKINQQKLTCHLLPYLNDIDEEGDLLNSPLAFLV